MKYEKTKRSKGGRYAAAKVKAPREKKPFRLRSLLLALIPAAAAVVAMLVVLLTVDMGSSFTLPEAGMQYYAGATAQVEKGSQLKYQTDGTVVLVRGDQASPIRLPIYSTESRTMVVVRDLIFYAPRTNVTGRAVHFSQVLCRDNGSVYLTAGDKQIQTGPGFLYDGEDLYVFLEPVTVTFNGYRMDLPALSYVEAIYGGTLCLFDYEKKESILEEPMGKVTVTPKLGGYSLSVLNDTMELEDGRKRMLFSDPEVIDPMA